MKKSFFLPLAFLFPNYFMWSQTIFPFNELLKKIEIEPHEKRDKMIEHYLLDIGKTPIVEKEKVIFLAKGGMNDAPILLADFNGFMNARYVQDTFLSNMQNITGTNWYFREKELNPDAIVNYQFSIGGSKMIDPLNPRVRINFGDMYSVVQMPKYRPPSETVLNHFYPKGTVLKDSLPSEIMGHTRTLHIYIPAGYENKSRQLPSVYFHDGSYYIEHAQVPQVLDNLIARQMIEPVIAIFDDPKIRGKEYRGDVEYRDYLKKELIPYISEKYSVKKEAEFRAVIGGSRGGLSALYVSHSLGLFGKCGAFSPAVHPKKMDKFVSELENFNYAPSQVFMTGSVYDHIWYNDAILLKEYFQKAGNNFQYLEISAGHNIPAWRSMLDKMLEAFFPYND